MSKITNDFRLSALRNGVIVRTRKSDPAAENVRYAAVLEMANLGFRVSPDALEGMSAAALNTMVQDARKVIGADRNMRPIYPGFPRQVQAMSTLTLIMEQLLHYWTAGAFLPNYDDVAREGLPLEDMGRADRTVEVLNAGEAARHLMRALTTRGIALSEDDKALLEGSVTLASPSLDEAVAIVKDARNGENIQTFVSSVFAASNGAFTVNDAVIAFVAAAKNADQVLRIVLALASFAVADRQDDYTRAVQNLSDADATSVKMSTLSRPARRAVMERLAEVTPGFHADMLMARQTLWRRVMRMVHPYSMSLNDDARRAADIVHSNIEYRTLNSIVEEGLEKGYIEPIVKLMAEFQPGNLLRRLVALLRAVSKHAQADALANAIRETAGRSAVTTLVSAYNGVLAINDSNARVTRVAGRNNTVREVKETNVNERYVNKVLNALEDALVEALKRQPAPKGAVAIVGDRAVPLVRRDLSTTDRVMDRGTALTPAGEGDTVRMFSHWLNNQNRAGYMDLGAVVLDENFKNLDVITWNTWSRGRAWATYSGDKNVYPGDNAAEYIDVDIAALKKALPKAAWVAMTIQSWSGFPMKNVDIIAGTMLRSKPDSGEVFDARTVTTAFKPTTEALQAVPLALNLSTGQMVWLDSSSGSTQSGVSADNDEAVGLVVYDELARPRLTMGDFARLWAKAHGAETVEQDVDRDALLALLD